MFEFKLPDLGEGIHEGEILKWHVAAGDAVREDDPLVDVETDKAAVTIPSPKSGRVVRTEGKRGDKVHVGQVIAVIDEGGTGTQPAEPATSPAAAPPGVPAPPASPQAPAAAAPTPPAAAAPATGSTATTTTKTGERSGPVPAAPATRRLARELDVALDLVPPTGPGGRVTPEDVRRFAAGPSAPTPTTTTTPAPAPAPTTTSVAAGIPYLDLEPLPDFAALGPVETEPLVSIRRKVARKMVTSSLLVPHVAHMDEADVTELEAFRKAQRERRGGEPSTKLTLLAFVVRAVVDALKRFPAFNASVDPFRELLVSKKYYHLGIAADTDRGLVVPVLRDADRRSLLGLAAGIADLARRAKEGKLELADLRGGTFTVTNIGALGGTSMVPLINYPEVGILGMGRVQERPVVRDGQIVARRMLPLTLSFDHRVTDGADAARFVNHVVRLLEDPAALLVET
ncbi:MAG: 2-oxo acid dehydrogenase subunit E2 [Deltaproteobacteria bacterium]|nr:2-oxo acid dehydrogenase subunit E2 [Deltaproteobacteria bacterium]